MQKCERSVDFKGVFTWFDFVLSFDSAGSPARKCEQDVNRKKNRRREGKFEAWEKTKAQPVRAGQIGDLQSSVLTAPLIRLLHIILYRCKVINAKAAVRRVGRNLYGSSIAHIVHWLYPLSGGNCHRLRNKTVALYSRLKSIDRTVTIVLEYSFAADCVIR